jgi:hypothetical protein
MKLTWGQKTRTEYPEKYPNKDIFQKGNIIRLSNLGEGLGEPERSPTPDALLMCNAIKSGKIKEYLVLLEEAPKKKIIGKFLGILYSKTSALPIVFDAEMPGVTIKRIYFERVQNVQARIITKITLLLIESESKKLGIWNQIQRPWINKYTLEIKMYLKIVDAMIKQCENSGQDDKAEGLRNSIDAIKKTNHQYHIDW